MKSKFVFSAKILLLLVLAACTGNRDDANRFFLLANEALKRGDHKTAIRYYNESLSKTEIPDAYLNLGLAYKSIGKNEEFEANVKKAIDEDPTFDEAHAVLAEYYLEQGKPEKTESELKLCSAKFTKTAKFNNIKGKFEFSQKKLHRAIGYLQAAVDLEPQNPDFLTDLAAYHFTNKELKKAEQLLNLALKQDSIHAFALNNLGLIQIHNGQTADGKKNIEKALSIDDLPVFKNNLAFALLKSGESAEAAQILNEINLQNDPYYLRNRSLLASSSNNPAVALRYLTKAYDLDPDIMGIHEELANIYVKMKNEAKACEILSVGVQSGETNCLALQKKICLK